MRYDLEDPLCSLVLIGKFNPAIFSPAWLAKVGVINEQELERSTVQVIHSEIAQFDVRRFRVEVQQVRFQISSSVAPFISVSDDTRRIFGEKLPHTPIRLGINFQVYFRLESAEKRMALGRALAPPEPWGTFGRRLTASRPERASGMAALVMQENQPEGREKGWRRVEIQPSRRPTDALNGVFIAFNDHFEVSPLWQPWRASLTRRRRSFVGSRPS